jgi:hypothetical protein
MKILSISDDILVADLCEEPSSSSKALNAVIDSIAICEYHLVYSVLCVPMASASLYSCIRRTRFGI